MIYRWEVVKAKVEGLEQVTGYIDIKIPKAEERMALLKEVNIRPNAEGKTTFDLDQIDCMIKISKKVKESIEKVELLVDKKIINRIEDLEYYAIYSTIINALSTIMFNGIPLGN